jgi:hypothetical protein
MQLFVCCRRRAMATGKELPDPHGRSWNLMPGKHADKHSHVNHWERAAAGHPCQLGMAMGRVRIGYGKYPPAIIPAGITHIRSRLYPRVGFCTRARTHRVSGGYRIPAGTTTWTATHDFLWRHG